jgi:hypothetical protein
MTDKAISKRLRQTEQLRKLSLSLMKAREIDETELAELKHKALQDKKANENNN